MFFRAVFYLILFLASALIMSEADSLQVPENERHQGDHLALQFFGADDCTSQAVHVSSFSTRTIDYIIGILPSGDLSIIVGAENERNISEIIRFALDSHSDSESFQTLRPDADFDHGQLTLWEWGHRTIIGLQPINDRESAIILVPSDTGCLDRFLELEQAHAHKTILVNTVITQRVDDPSSESISIQDALNEIGHQSTIVDPPQANASGQVGSTRTPFVCISGGPGALSCSFSAGSVGPVGSMTCSVNCVPPSYACCGLGFLSNCACINGASSGGGIPPSAPPDPGSGGGGGGGGSGGGGGGGGFPPGPGDGDDDDDDDDGPGDESTNVGGTNPSGP